MAGPASIRSSQNFLVPPGEAQVLYSANTLSYKVQNFEVTPEGTLRSIVGPTRYEPDRTKAQEESTQGLPHGIYHAGLLGGIADTLIVRMGTELKRHEGWSRSFRVLESGLSDEHRPIYPDQFAVLGNTIIWTNGIDRARAIAHDGMVVPLGFDQVPGAPFAEGPQQPNPVNRTTLYSNALGYSWPGRIGTVGDLLDGQTGSLLSGGWYYYVQWEDVFGNLSQLSAQSNLVKVSTLQADPYIEESAALATEIDDLTRQFLVRIAGDAPEHAVAFRLYRTPDVKHTGIAPHLIARVPGSKQFFYPDNRADSDLGPEALETIAVPVFRVMCTHQGRLVIGNTVADPGVVRRSQVGLPGTFAAADWIYPDSGGSEVTGLVSHNGKLIAFTENSTYELQDFSLPIPLAQGVGCVAPRSIKALPDGTLIWLSRDGFYGMKNGTVRYLSRLIQRTVRNYVNRTRMRMAVSVIDPTSGEYRCALAPAGKTDQSLVLCYDGENWRRQELGLHIADWCQTDDYRQYVLAVGTHPKASKATVKTLSTEGLDNVSISTSSQTVPLDKHEVYVMDRETKAYDPPDRELIYRSGWMRGDGVGLTPMHIRTMYLGMVDAWNGDFTVRFYRNGSWADVVKMEDVLAVGVDDETKVIADICGSAVIGTAKTHDPRLFWRRVPVGLENAYSWAFEISASSPTRLHLASFAFDITVATKGNIRSRVPHRTDV
tara:strand:+ start:2646 stop:4787 length:2142 start_codon:yes stop_codon:yes gene_type:complete